MLGRSAPWALGSTMIPRAKTAAVTKTWICAFARIELIHPEGRRATPPGHGSLTHGRFVRVYLIPEQTASLRGRWIERTLKPVRRSRLLLGESSCTGSRSGDVKA